MAYTLNAFGADVNAALKAKGLAALPDLAEKLGALLRNPDFVAATFSEEDRPGRRVIWHDPETDTYVLAHVHPAGQRGKPHNHGASWAIYGTARGLTHMAEWQRVNPADDANAVLERRAAYDLHPGEARAYGPHMPHSVAHTDKTWVVRVTGGDLDSLPRYRFNAATDTIREQA